jgi:hypothetical protein
MKMKKVTLGFSILALSGMFILGCKKEPNVAPIEDDEVQSSIDAVWATYVVSDLDMICSFLGENDYLNTFYKPVPANIYGPNNGTMTPIRNANYLSMSWGVTPTGEDTKCVDGRRRQGTVFMDYECDLASNPDCNPNANYYRIPGFTGKLSCSNYKIDGWIVELTNGAEPAIVYNRTKPYNYNPLTVPLIWEIGGSFKFTHPTDPKRNIVWSGKIWKTLVNTKDPKVFKPTKDAAITWSLATVTYSGDISGTTTGNVPFKMHIESQPLVRTFTCSPDQVEGVALTNTPGTIVSLTSQHHPFVGGIASFTTGEKYPRQIYFGTEGDKDFKPDNTKLPPVPCDNNGEVLVKGISYKVTFSK